MDMHRSVIKKMAFLAAFFVAGFFGCKSGSSNDGDVDATNIPAASMNYIVLAWNDLGMHCLNPTYNKAVILPPYNTVWAQVIQRGDPPRIVIQGISVRYSIVGNTYSYGKRSYGQFWDNCLKLFGTTLTRDTGLNLEDPGIHNGLSGTMVAKAGHFQANGIPVTPVSDAGAWDPYQVAEIVVTETASGAELARTRATVPTSDEIHCGKCHGQDPLLDVLVEHDDEHGTRLAADRPVLCAGCHGSPGLGQSGPGTSGHYLSAVIHRSHASREAACYDCHPGDTTKCSRSTPHTAADGNCESCHGSMSEVGNSVESGARIPWVEEPKCADCHAGVAEVDTGNALFRNGHGHNGLSCPACHGSPHAMIPTSVPADNVLVTQYQTAARALGSCAACHSSSRGEGSAEFMEAHGGSRATACTVCHTRAPGNDTARWPHQFQWKAR